MTAAFSAKISSLVSPSTSVCSRAMLVSTTTGALTTLVASRRPPSPASSATASTPLSAKASRAATVSTSNCVVSPSSPGSPATSVRTRSTAAANTGSSTGRPSTITRSVQPEMCGERYAPERSPWARSSASQ